jgi:hypothetical protein
MRIGIYKIMKQSCTVGPENILVCPVFTIFTNLFCGPVLLRTCDEAATTKTEPPQSVCHRPWLAV